MAGKKKAKKLSKGKKLGKAEPKSAWIKDSF